jgi:hypothetical protein
MLVACSKNQLREMEILEIPLITSLAFTPHPSLLDETTSHSTKLPKTAAKSLVTPQAGEGVEAPSLVRAACGGGLGRAGEGVCGWDDVIFIRYFRKFHLPNGHGKCAAPDDEACHDRFPHLNPLPQAGEEANESLREFHVNRLICYEFVERTNSP